jgi:hypothetical protein
VLDHVGQPARVDAFEDRFMIQKKVYLARLTELDLGYRFGWYLRGPYCRELTYDVYRLTEQLELGDEDYKGEELSPRAARLAGRAREIWAGRPEGISEADWLELLASLHYLKHIAYWPRGTPQDFDGIFKGLVDSKPRFKGRKADARKAWGHLEKVGLLKQKVLPAA